MKAAASIISSGVVPVDRVKDDLLRIFGSDRISGFMAKLGMENGQPIEHPMVSKAVENAQRKVEAHHFDMRKHVLEYDDVMNRQREVIYALRRDILTGENQKDILYDMADEVLEETLANVIPKDTYPEEWDIEGLNENLERLFGISITKVDDKFVKLDGEKEIKLESYKAEELHDDVFKIATSKYDLKEKEVSPGLLRKPERMIMLQVLDNLWRDHLLAMDHLKEGIGLRSYAQKNPLNEYKKEGFDLFRNMNFRMKEEICEFLFKVQINREAVESLESQQEKEERKVTEHRGEGAEEQKTAPVKRDENKVGRNDPCPCGSGKKYKKCHGQ
jgi:preprotein translocase subunit SecA